MSDDIHTLIYQIHSDPSRLQNVDPRDFEDLVWQLLEHRGLSVGKISDGKGGYDLQIHTSDPESTTLVECKARSVDVDEVRKLREAVSSLEAQKGMIVTSSHLSASALDLVRENSTQLHAVDADGLLEWITQYVKAQEPSANNPLSLYFDMSEFSHQDVQNILRQLSSLYQECGGDHLTIEHVDILDPTSLFVPG